MQTLFRKRTNTITIPLELKKTSVVELINNTIDQNLNFPGTIIVNLLGIDSDTNKASITSSIQYYLQNITNNIFTSITSGNITLLNQPIGEYQINIQQNSIPQNYNIVQPISNQYLNENQTIAFNVNISKTALQVGLGNIFINIKPTNLGGWQLKYQDSSGNLLSIPSNGSFNTNTNISLNNQTFGIYTIVYQPINNYITPNSQTLVLDSNNTSIEFDAIYSFDSSLTGSIAINATQSGLSSFAILDNYGFTLTNTDLNLLLTGFVHHGVFGTPYIILYNPDGTVYTNSGIPIGTWKIVYDSSFSNNNTTYYLGTVTPSDTQTLTKDGTISFNATYTVGNK